MRAVVTAGGCIAGAYAKATGTHVKALVEIGGRTMLDRVLTALRGAGATEIAVVGGEDVRRALGSGIRFVQATASGSENLVRALNAWPAGDAPLLYATSDMPFVEAASIADFVARTPPGCVALPLADYAAFVRRFPHAPPCGITLGGERVVNGDVFLIPGRSAAAIGEVARGFFEARKRPWKMAKLTTPGMLLRLLLGRLPIAQIETHAGRVLGVRALAVRSCAPELAFDADTIEDYRFACRIAGSQ